MTLKLSTILGAITIPTPQVYDPEFPHRNQEGFYYACLQILQQLQTADFTFADATDSGGLTQAVKDLKMRDVVFDFGFCRIYLSGQIEYV